MPETEVYCESGSSDLDETLDYEDKALITSTQVASTLKTVGES